MAVHGGGLQRGGSRSLHLNTGLTGMDRVLQRLNIEIQKIKGRTMAGLIQSAMLIHESMDEINVPLIPEDLGNLRASWFYVTATEKSGEKPFIGEKASQMATEHASLMNTLKPAGGKKIMLWMGFSANYAMAVHEMVDSKFSKPVNWSRPGSGAKFFEQSFKRHAKDVIEIIKANAQIKT
jgi:hypothetical protein